MKELFNLLTGNRGYSPHEYQERAANCILEGKNILLCAPTGAGKTWAALLPFLMSWKERTPIADRLIYVLPLRSLASSLYNETVTCCSNTFKVKNIPQDRTGVDNEIVITIQTGEQKDDPFFEGDIIFTTVDQCLSSYINMPVSLPKRVGNINAGAMLGSLIVLDEFHLLDPEKSMRTSLEMLARLKPFSNFIIMTATLSTNSMELLKSLLDTESIQLSEKDVLALPSHAEKRRTFRWINHALTIDDIIKNHGNNRSIVIVNTVKRSQELFSDLKNYAEQNNIRLFLLHSRFYPKDRKKTENDLNSWFGKDAEFSNAILVTTQVVEAGIDISSDNMFTELAPMNSLIQRAGRCARYTGNRGIGTVWIYELEEDDNGKLKLGPYRDQTEIMKDSRKVLESLSTEGVVLDFTAELESIDKVHAEQDVISLKFHKQDIYTFKGKVHEAMDGQNKAAVRELIRDIAAVNIIVSDNPKMLRFDKREWPQLLSVPRSSLFILKQYLSGIIDDTWVAAIPEDMEDEESGLYFNWRFVTSMEELKNASWLVVVHPDFASYTPEIGLQLGESGAYEPPKYLQRPLIPRYKIRYETYAEHANRTIGSCREMHVHYQNASFRLAEHYKKNGAREIEKFAELACALHDAGKLSQEWQNRIKKWQEYKDGSKLSDEPIAHSDYDPETDFDKKRGFPKPPPHAAEGAYAVLNWLFDCMDSEIATVILTSITRHHGAFTETLKDFRLTGEALKWIEKTIKTDYPQKLTIKDRPPITEQNNFKNDLLCFSKNSNDESLWPFYAYLTRRLRLADQGSQKEKGI